jgi:hypothetical protein
VHAHRLNYRSFPLHNPHKSTQPLHPALVPK